MSHQQTAHSGRSSGNGERSCLPFSGAKGSKADRLPPQNLEAERSVLGSCLLDNDQIDEIAAWLTESDFYRDVHQAYWRAILAVRDSGQSADAVTVPEYLERQGKYHALGGNDTLTEIVNAVPHAANARYYAAIVREKSVARQVAELSTATLDEVFSNLFTAPELVERLEAAVFAITDRAVVGETIDAQALVGETWGRLKTLQERRTVGIPTGFGDLDDMIGGLAPGQLVILAARPAIGKTALGLNLASQVAGGNQGVLFVSLEMSRTELGNRLIASFGGVAGDALLKPWFLGDADWNKIIGACNQISQFPLFIDDTPQRTVSQIQANARRIKHRSPCGLGLIVVDYLGLVNGQKQKGESRQEEVARVSRRLKAAARDLKVPLIALHQLNRGIENRDDRRPRMADLRESGQIEQDADLILLLHRPDAYDPADRPGEADLIVAKNRNGQTGTVRLAFNGPLTRFDSLAPPGEEPPPEGQPF